MRQAGRQPAHDVVAQGVGVGDVAVHRHRGNAQTSGQVAQAQCVEAVLGDQRDPRVHHIDGGQHSHDSKYTAVYMAPSSLGRLLLVVLDDFGRPHLGSVWVLPGIASRPSLTQEIPTLIELNRDVRQLRPVVVGQRAPRRVLLEFVLVSGQPVDLLHDVAVVHVVS